MTLEPNNRKPEESTGSQPPRAQKEGAKPPDTFHELETRATDISIELIEASAEPRLSEIIADCLGSHDRANEFAGCVIPICEDPSSEALIVQDRLCRAIASQIRSLANQDIFDNIEKLRRASAISDAILVSSEVNPRGQNCDGLQDLLRAEVFLLRQLDEDRAAILDEENRATLGSELAATAHTDWIELYVRSVDQVLLGLKLSGLIPSEDFLVECRELVACQLSWTGVGMGPTESRTQFEAQIWAETLCLARAVADSSLEDSLLGVADQLVRWFNAGALNGGGIFEETGKVDDTEIHNILGWLELAEHRAMAALLRAQSSCATESFWREVLETRPLSSRAARIALHGLAKCDASETAEYVAKLLNRLGSSKCGPALADRYFDTLIRVAAEPGVAEVVTNAWDPQAEYPVDPLRKELLLDRVETRLRLHDKQVAWARRRIEECEDDASSRQRIELVAGKRGAIFSKRALATLQKLADS